jgi:hypothetical protein
MEQEEETKTFYCCCLHSDNDYYLIAIIHVAGRGFPNHPVVGVGGGGVKWSKFTVTTSKIACFFSSIVLCFWKIEFSVLLDNYRDTLRMLKVPTF